MTNTSSENNPLQHAPLSSLQKTELLKLAAALNCPPQQLNGLHSLRASELRRIRMIYNDRVHDRFSRICKRLAQACRFLPNSISSRIVENVFGPQLAAQIAVHLPAKTVAGIVKNVSSDFLAEVVHYLDSRRAESMLSGLPTTTIERIIAASVARGNYATLAELAEELPREQVLSLAEALDEPADLLRIYRYMTDKASLTRLVNGLDEQLISKALLATHNDEDLAETALDLLAFMPVEIQRAAAAQALQASPENSQALAQRAATHPRRATLDAFISACR